MSDWLGGKEERLCTVHWLRHLAAYASYACSTITGVQARQATTRYRRVHTVVTAWVKLRGTRGCSRLSRVDDVRPGGSDWKCTSRLGDGSDDWMAGQTSAG